MTATPHVYTCTTDNYTPGRGEVQGTAYAHNGDVVHRDGTIVLVSPELRDAQHALYVWDDGLTVTVFYVSAWNGAPPSSVDRVVLRPVEPGMSLGPRRCYTLHARAHSADADNV